jgi:chemotaxis protein methyltransferase CheR
MDRRGRGDMRDQDFELFKKILNNTSGLALTPDKTYLLETRLGPVITEFDCESIDDLADRYRKTKDDAIATAVMEAMTTNETSFMRDARPFEKIRDVILPNLHAARQSQKRLRIWSAACSSGQEALSLLMVIKEHEHLDFDGWDIKILGTDISRDILAKAKQATYSQFEVQRGLPIKLLVKYFDQNGDQWTAKPELLNHITYQPGNLLKPFDSLGQFDLILCRNVLIYFTSADKKNVLDRLSTRLRDDGYLMLGGAETILGVTNQLQHVKGETGLYQPADNPNQTKAANAR